MSITGRSSSPLFARRKADLGDALLVASFVGGMRYGYTGIASWSRPLITLDIYQSGLELRPTHSFLRFLVPVWRARFDEILVVNWMGSPKADTSVVMGLTRGVKFTTTDGDWVIFWCFDRDRLLEVLAGLALTIAERKRFNYFNP